MDVIDEQQTEPSPSRDSDKVEPGDLLDECWFFGNLLDRKARMLRSFSDPCTSSNFKAEEIFAEKSYEETYASINKLSDGERSDRPVLTRTQSTLAKGTDHPRNKLMRQVPSNNLRRAPSLPTSLDIEEDQDEESDFSMGKLIRQASLNQSKILPPKRQATKGITRQTSSIPPSGQQSKHNNLRPQKSLNNIEIERLRGIKELGINIKDMNPNEASTIARLEERTSAKEVKEKQLRRTNTWRAHSSAPPCPKWTGTRSNEDMKAQLKFWARAVASNVRQEC